MKKIINGLLCLLLLCACGAPTTSNNKYCDSEDMTCGLKESADMSEYDGFDDKHNAFVEISMDEAIEMYQNKQSGIIYFGFPNCPWCLEAIPLLNEVALEHEAIIYYVRTRNQDHELLYDDEDKALLFPYMEDFLDTNDEGKLHLFVPFVVAIKDGVTLDAHIGTLDSHDPNERKMNDEEITTLKQIYDDLITSVE